ncbi:GerMN domain-containing protein [Paenibacillus sp. Leaf72]|uniref:GerMN domain-containing protein n=1 Tax=Paenibacillus sp. Leaf72 TaxID=1736234 RepID=UPI0006F2983C|nr:GerMN domain-containing protein [Paenibacillus sp. Leaf72]KQO01304.1 hypothetical protein ASF12_15840 [Paenibacillus sp. Leaf72]
MVQTKWIRLAAISGVMVVPLLTAGCGLFSTETSKEIDPPQTESTNVIDGTNTGQTSSVNPQGEETQLTVYLEDKNGYLAPISLLTTLGGKEAAGQKALEMMVDGGAYASQLPEDFQAVIPQGTQIKSYHVDPQLKMATVEFSAPFADYTATKEREIVEAITWTLTAMTGIEKVELWYEGSKLSEMPVDGFPLDRPLTRSVGINLETADGVSSAYSTPVTLYFSSQTSNEEQYYVPVTRLIARPESTVKAAVEELIAGPLNRKQLNGVMTNDVQVTSIEQKNDTVTVDLQDTAYESGQNAPAEMLQAVVLSVTENTGAAKVQIRLNGEANVVDDQNTSYNEPVGRPHHVNAMKS